MGFNWASKGLNISESEIAVPFPFSRLLTSNDYGFVCVLTFAWFCVSLRARVNTTLVEGRDILSKVCMFIWFFFLGATKQLVSSPPQF